MNCVQSENPQAAQACADLCSIPQWKRVLDITCVLLAAPVSIPLALIIALIIKSVSRGPVLFRQQRVGYRGKAFLCLKFRTMVVNADAGVHTEHLTRLMSLNCAMTKLDAAGDPRLIPGGRLLRSLGLDELPQLINVLRGEMSLVGPRPCLPYEYQKYLPRHKRRCNTLPGLTGLWQVSGKNDTTFEEMIDLDLEYAEKKSLLLDLKIMALTIPAILTQVFELRAKRRSVSAGTALGQGPSQLVTGAERLKGSSELINKGFTTKESYAKTN